MSSNRLFQNTTEPQSTNTISPSVRYFIEKQKGNTELANHYAIEARAYVRTVPVNDRTSPDWYFSQLISLENYNGHCQLSYPQQKKILDYYEKESIKYVEQLNVTKSPAYK